MKSYEEIAKEVFERRDEYIAKKAKQKKLVISAATAIFCCVIVVAGFGLYKNVGGNNDIYISDNSQNELNSSNNKEDTAQNNTSSRDEIISDDTSSNPSSGDTNNASGNDTSSTLPSNTDDIPSKENRPDDSGEANEFMIDSIDKINFYSAKKIINEQSLFPFGLSNKNNASLTAILLDNNYVEYPIDHDKIYTITMVTYFTITLNDENGFLAQKLGGTGSVEVVVTENDINSSGQMITFKREGNYYTCFMNGQSFDFESSKTCREFSTHIYIDGFNTVKNFEQENFKFTVNYEGSKVVGFECTPFKCEPQKYSADDVTLIEDYCVVLFTTQYFTIDQLEIYLKNNTKELCYEKINGFYTGFRNVNLFSWL